MLIFSHLLLLGSVGLGAVLARGGDRQAQALYTLRTEARAYHAVLRPEEGVPHRFDAYDVRVVARFHNASRATVYLARCRPTTPHPRYEVEPIDTAARGASSPYRTVCAGVGHPNQFPVAPGRTRVDTLLLDWPGAVDGYTHTPQGTPVGRFRLVYFVQDVPGDSPRGEAAVYSAAFSVRPGT